MIKLSEIKYLNFSGDYYYFYDLENNSDKEYEEDYFIDIFINKNKIAIIETKSDNLFYKNENGDIEVEVLDYIDDDIYYDKNPKAINDQIKIESGKINKSQTFDKNFITIRFEEREALFLLEIIKLHEKEHKDLIVFGELYRRFCKRRIVNSLKNSGTKEIVDLLGEE